MRPRAFDIDIATVDLDGLANGAEGATFTLTANDAGDGLAHRLSITGEEVTDHSAKTCVWVGTDADGNAQTETTFLPNGTATVETVKYYKTLTSCTPSATTGTDGMDIGWVDEVASQTIVLDAYAEHALHVQVNITGTINFDIEVMSADPFLKTAQAPFNWADQNSWPWMNDANWAGKTADTMANLASVGVRAMRFIVNSYSSGAEAQIYLGA
jgi:hypothetical protein